MQKKINVGILGATGMVGQKYIHLLRNHPWFEVSYLAASPNSAGMKYRDAVKDRWHMEQDIPDDIADIVVEDASNADKVVGKCKLVFSAFEAGSREIVREIENRYALLGIAVFSNASAHRWSEDVPMLIPEINSEHLKIISVQQKNHGWEKGFIVVKPNCSLQSYLLPIFALMQAGFEVQKLIITTMQAVSGAGYPGVASLDIIDNIVPFIGGEEEKTELEPLKILGHFENGKFVNFESLQISAHCNRVPVIDGHTACINMLFGSKKPTKDEILKIWKAFRGEPQELNLPSAPINSIIYLEEENRPQPKRDRDNDRAMAVTVGRLRKCSVFDFKFVGLSHNTVRGAAGGGILNAELALQKGFIK